ncbi:MAG: methyltransferase domain-containing protein [Candidatus Yanofskybacteria bacterium]|nr:methyltransferase domain-containing protein [Candidatus Yanofskybacteria bacterium]
MKNLQTIQKAYARGENIAQYLRKGGRSKNTLETIMVSYDLQSGSYIKRTKKNSAFHERYTKAIASVINGLGAPRGSILEAGVGEATTLAHVIPKLDITPKTIYGFDLSWSRVRYAAAYAKRRKLREPFLFTADLFNIPMADHSIDIVYTSHSIESNGGKEREALRELMRVTRRYLVLLEPAYEFANQQAKERMRKYGYVRNLLGSARSLGFRVEEHRPFDISVNPLNPTGLLVLEASRKSQVPQNPLMCPIAKTPLHKVKGSYFSKGGLFAYPIIDGIPCLLADNAVIATHYMDNFQKI